MEFLAAKVWLLFWITATLAMLCFAYYARNEAIQKIASALFLAFVISHIFDGMAGKIPFYALTDLACLAYCLYIWRTVEPSNPAPLYIASIFALMLLTHGIAEVGFMYGRALDVLFALQLVTLCIYSHQYGKAARSHTVQHRDDMFYKAVLWMKLHKTISH